MSFHPRRFFRRLLGIDLETIGRENERLRHLLEFALSSPHAGWLYRNRVERMDATVPGLFDPLRQRFHLARYEFAASRVHGCQVADIACGTGYGTKHLRVEGGARRCVGIDIDEQAVAYARDVHRAAEVEFVCSSGEDTGLTTGAFDAVVSFETIEHVPDPGALLAEFHRILSPAGVLIVSTPNDWPLEDAPFHLQRFTAESFRTLLESRFTIGEMWAQNSGSPSPHNFGQLARLVPGTLETLPTAEVLVAVCRRR